MLRTVVSSASYGGAPTQTVGLAGLSIVTVAPATGSAIVCQHCDNISARIIADCLVVVQRHHGQWHKSVIPLIELGYDRLAEPLTI